MFYLRDSSITNYIQTHRADLTNYNDPLKALSDLKPLIINILSTNTLSSRIRFIICMDIKFYKRETNDSIKENDFYFCSYTERILSKYQIEDKVNNAIEKILSSVETFVRFGSGWVIDKIKFVDLNLGYYNDLYGGCGFVMLPKELKVKHCLLHIKNTDNRCFLYCILGKLFPNKCNKNRVSSYNKYLKRLNFSFLKFPVTISQISDFETKNNLSINLYGYENKSVFPIRVSKLKFQEINILLYKKHYFLITNFGRLLHEKSGYSLYCKNCLLSFKRKETLINHQSFCLMNKPQKLKMPEIGNNLMTFSSFNKMIKHPFSIYCDFECLTVPFHTVSPKTDKSFSLKTQKHEPIAYAFLVIDDDQKIVFHHYYSGLDCVENFFIVINSVQKTLLTYMQRNEPMVNVPDNTPRKCHICKKDFTQTDKIVRDHNHLTGQFVGFAHRSPCNLNYKLSNFIPIVIHNLSGYDSHLIFKKISDRFAKKITVIPVNAEKYTTFTIDNLKFIDSYHFLSSPLSKLVENLKNSNYEFPIFNSFFHGNKYRKLLLRKGLFPYSYFNNPSILSETSPPKKEDFFNDLTQEHITDSDYDLVKKVWKKFRCSTFENYLKIYLFTDCILLADVFENFRKISLENYELEPLKFISAPDLTWTAGLKMTGVTLELLTDVDMYLLLERGIRGGICILGKRYSKCNNPYVKETFNPLEKKKYIVSFDVNNLYGYVMTSFLPVSNFKWMTPREISKFDVSKISPNSSIGYILECDLEYPDNLHDKHNDFPLAPEHFSITYNDLSPYQRDLLEKNECKQSYKTQKLIPNFRKKEHYIVHYMNLKFYLDHGLILTKIHKIISFNQQPWLKKYVDYNNEKRKLSCNEFDKCFYKLLNNSFFGRSCMNVRKQVNVKIAINQKETKKHLSSSALEYFSPINDYCALFKKKRSTLCLNKPIFIGFTVLELSKLHMYRLFYDVFKKFYDQNVTLLYMDTDSFTLEITCEDFYDDLKNKLPEIFDTSNYPKSHKLFSKSNENKLGYFKDETKGIPIKEFCSLKPKMYSYIFDDSQKSTAKGVKKSVLKNLTHNMYKNVLDEKKFKRCIQQQIISKKHDINTVLVNKKSLCAFYDKKFVLSDGIHSLSFGHYKIKDEEID